MKKLKEMNVIFMIVISSILFSTTYCQFSETGKALDLIANGLKAIFGMEHMFKTFKKVSSGMIPFPYFVPILPKSKVIKLFSGKKSNNEDKAEPLSDSSSQMSPIILPPRVPLMPSFVSTLNNPYNQLNNDYQFYNMKPKNMVSDYALVVNNGLSAQSPIEDDIKPNGLDYDYMQNPEVSNTYSERYESGIPEESEEDTIEDHDIHTPLDVVQNWDTIDDELRTIGYRLGKLGHILYKN